MAKPENSIPILKGEVSLYSLPHVPGANCNLFLYFRIFNTFDGTYKFCQ